MAPLPVDTIPPCYALAVPAPPTHHTPHCPATIAGETLQLRHDRSIHWPAKQTLLMADPHFGKAATFRHAGIPVPDSTLEKDLQRLSQAIAETRCTRLIVLGDFFHARQGKDDSTLGKLTAWREQHNDASLRIDLVRGNHDQHAGDPPTAWRFHLHDEPWLDDTLKPFVFQHHPGSDHRGHTLAGHLHPGVRLPGVRGASMPLPCFHVSEADGDDDGSGCTVLPPFGSFTGHKCIKAGRGDRVYVVTPETVVALPCPPK